MSLARLSAAVIAALAVAAPAGAATTSSMLPFPSDAYTARSTSTPTGRVLAFRRAQMPRNAKGVHVDPSQYRGLDGFSPGSVILARVPGLQTSAALKRTNPVGLSDISRYAKRDAPVLVVDARTGRRWPVWAELDTNATQTSQRLLEIHPAKNFAEGHRYVVVLRNLRRANGSRILAPRGSTVPARLSRTLHRAHVRRGRTLYAAWDFTVASEKSLAQRMLHIRDDAFAQLGDRNLADLKVEGHAPSFAVTSVEDFTPAQNAEIARRVTGSFTVPCYLDKPGCPPGSSFHYPPGRTLPSQLPANVATAPFICVIPRAATPATPSRVSLYGHGLLGSGSEVNATNVADMAAEHDITFCATDWAGMAKDDIPNAVAVLGDLSHMKTLADRLQQGLLNQLYLGRLLIHPQGFAANAAFQAGGVPVIDPSHLFFDGNSQGGIAGGALTAFAPDYTRAVLGVPAMNYSVLLPRSRDFDAYSKVLYPAYPRQSDRPLVLDLAQILWDRGEADGVAAHITDHPLPNTPAHQVLMHVAFGDQQVSMFQAEVEARTIGARVHQPALAAGRSPQRNPLWGIAPLPSGRNGGSAIVFWDAGAGVVAPPPLVNQPPRVGPDPHEFPRSTPAARQQKSDFLQAGGAVVDTCGGAPCRSVTSAG
ncbi:MAG: hypothetical protein ACXVFN_07380 [Solirubrobacteraceae bacterium]